jgi:hypothetical protein
MPLVSTMPNNARIAGDGLCVLSDTGSQMMFGMCKEQSEEFRKSSEGSGFNARQRYGVL